MKFDFAQII